MGVGFGVIVLVLAEMEIHRLMVKEVVARTQTNFRNLRQERHPLLRHPIPQQDLESVYQKNLHQPVEMALEYPKQSCS
jgi:hypothetical protein